MSHRNLLLSSLGFLVTFLVGCGGSSGPPTAKVTGIVVIDGKPLPVGTVMFHPEKGAVGTGILGEGGQYEAAEVPIGKVKISISVPEAPPKMPMPKVPGAAPEPELPHEAALPLIRKLPDTCRDPARSGLILEVKEGENRLDIKLKSRTR